MDDLITCFASGIVIGLTLMASAFDLKDIDDQKTVKRTEVVKEVDLILDEPQSILIESVIITKDIGKEESNDPRL